jgi:DNA modification methylase
MYISRIEGRIMPNLNFAKQNTLYATHGLHAFAAKCPPQLVQYGLRYYSKRGELVLDPMAGSGTTLVEAQLMGRNSIGFEIDPVARLIASVKTRCLDDDSIAEASKFVIDRTMIDIAQLKNGRKSSALYKRAMPPNFHNRDYWFLPEVAASLSILAYHISKAAICEHIRDFLWVVFSSLILSKTSVANARDIIHSRHHHYNHSEPPDVIAKFIFRVSRMRKQMAEFSELCRRTENATAEVRLGDARSLDLKDETIDLVFTSPPYVTALDYPRAHFMVVPWMKDILGITLTNYKERAEIYIGSERGRFPTGFKLDDDLRRYQLITSVLLELAKKSERQAKLTQRYFLDMQCVLAQMLRVLKPHKHAIIVVCPSNIRNISIPTHDVFIEMSQKLGFTLKKRHVRTINERRRVLPYMSAFGARMSTEYVLVFQRN